MVTLTTAKGLEIACDSVVAGRQNPFIHINTSALTRIEADTIFDDPEQTAVLRAAYADGSVRTFRGYTQLFSVQISPFVDGDLLIWLQPPIQVEEDTAEEAQP